METINNSTLFFNRSDNEYIDEEFSQVSYPTELEGSNVNQIVENHMTTTYASIKQKVDPCSYFFKLKTSSEQ